MKPMTTILLPFALSLAAGLYVQRRERLRIARACEELAAEVHRDTTGQQALSAVALLLRKTGSLERR